jgi:hypothetical protein
LTAGKRILGEDHASLERLGEPLKKKGNTRATASFSLLLAATIGQQGEEKQNKDDPKQRIRGDHPSPKPTIEAGSVMTQSLKQSPPLQIETTTIRSNRIPSYLITTTSSKTDLWILSQRPRPLTKTGLIGRAPAGSGPDRRPPWTPERGATLPPTDTARRRRLEATRHSATTSTLT